MSLKHTLQHELDYEKKLLAKDTALIASYPDLTLTCSRRQNGKPQFYFRKRGEQISHYLSLKDVNMIRHISFRKFLLRRSEALMHNIALLSQMVNSFEDYDDEMIISQLPKAYRSAIDFLKSQKNPLQAPAVIQSENPAYRDQLNIICTNGLLVRSKDEMAIVEELIRFNIEFRYEMRLELTRITTRSDGTAVMETVTRYPDFTIFLADGSVLYWEHAGRFDDEVYRKDHFDKIVLYFQNDIRLGKNLIVTMDGKDNAFDNMTIRNVVQTQILPFC